MQEVYQLCSAQPQASGLCSSLEVLPSQHEQQALGPLGVPSCMRRLGRPQQQRLLLLCNAQGCCQLAQGAAVCCCQLRVLL